MWMYEWRAWPQSFLTALLVVSLPSSPAARVLLLGGVRRHDQSLQLYSCGLSDWADWHTQQTHTRVLGLKGQFGFCSVRNLWTSCEAVEASETSLKDHTSVKYLNTDVKPRPQRWLVFLSFSPVRDLSTWTHSVVLLPVVKSVLTVVPTSCFSKLKVKKLKTYTVRRLCGCSTDPDSAVSSRFFCPYSADTDQTLNCLQ